MVKLLLFRGSPRSNITAVESENRSLEEFCDVLCVRYAFEFDAYKYARDYFLEHTEYDYLLIATDDIVVKQKHIQRIKNNLEYRKNKDGTCYYFPVITGIMNVDQHEYDQPKGNLNICYELGLKDRRLRSYNWIKRDELAKDDIFQVKFSGFPLMAIRRDIVEMFPFNSDGVFRGTGVEFGASLDFVFCWNCHEAGVPIYVDKRIDMQHLRISGQSQAGEREKEVWLNGKLLHMGLINKV